MKLLLSLKPKLIESVVRPNKRTPLHFAVEEKFENGKQLELIQFLIEHNANVSAVDARGNTPLLLAVLPNPSSPELISIIRLLIENNADPNILDTCGHTFLCNAAGNVGPSTFHEIFSYFVTRPNANMFNIMKMQGNLGSTVLHEAVYHFELLNETLQLINDLNLDFSAVDKKGDTIFHYAIWGGRDVSFLKTLIRYGADWEIENESKENSLHWAAGYGNLHAIKLLIDLGVDVNAVNIVGDTALSSLFVASETPPSNTFELVKELLNYGANVDIVNNCGKSALKMAQYKADTGEIDQSVVDLMVKASKRTIFEL
ncbi:unnamed protein product [Orchesella dallaii]|uniref:Ankyrin repeat protein n=1 Tax=Orchesella dallaii TaxID=48710 RepID=A0ABP1RAC3_9HEXA